MGKRSIIYVDGFNFYYGALRRTPYKWLDLVKTFRLMRPHDELVEVKYFTSKTGGEPGTRQAEYLLALTSLAPMLSIKLGARVTRPMKCGVNDCLHSGSRLWKKRCEKQTDVNIALAMVMDALDKKCDIIVLVSGDTDMVPALELIRDRRPEIKRIVYVPMRGIGDEARSQARELHRAATKVYKFPRDFLVSCQLPDEVRLRKNIVRCPPKWKEPPQTQ